MKKLPGKSAVLALALGVLAWLSGLAPGARATPPQTVATHAYVYFNADGSAPRAPTLLLDQGTALGALSCELGTGEAPPRSAEELEKLVLGPRCADSLTPQSGPFARGTVQIFAQEHGSRLVFNQSNLLAGKAAGFPDPETVLNISGTSLFDRSNPDQFNATYTYIQTAGGRNSTVTTGTSSYLRAFDAVIQAPVLPANVLQ